MSESIKVVVRVRPINSKEVGLGCKQIVSVDQPNNQLTIFKPEQPDNIKNFAYDSVFATNSIQSNVYAKTAYSLVQNVLQGYNGTIFAYGQTGCGKTHSMIGKIDNEQLQGIIPRSFGHILNTISETKNKQFLIRCSFIQIYNEEVRDLLGKDIRKSLQIKESPEKGVFIKDLSSNPAKTHEQLMEYMNLGNRNRSVGETAMNKDSSRSHLLFMLYLESADLSVPQQTRKYMASKLNLVDLAGSERINKTGAQGERLQQAKNINLSLSALGNVISALVDGKSHHIPYRDSKLTRLLQDSLGGNTKTVMIANCSPADYNFDETLSTLRYASRAKFIKNKPIINEDPKDALLKQYANEIRKLKEMVARQGGEYAQGGSNRGLEEYNVRMKEKERQLANEKEQIRLLQQKLESLQKQQLHSDNVRVDTKIKQRVREARISALSVDLLSGEMLKDIKVNDDKIKQGIFPNYSALKKIPIPESTENSKQAIKYYKSQIKILENELKDVAHENYLDKQCVLNEIRELSKENRMLEGIVNILVSPKQLEKIKMRIQMLEKQQIQANVKREGNFIHPNDKEITKYGYDEDKKQYNIPYFWLKQKDMILPKILNFEQLNPSWLELKTTPGSDNQKLNVCFSNDESEGQEKSRKKEADKKELSKIVNSVSKNAPDGDKNSKNNSSVFGKAGKQNKKDLLGVRDVIEEAREIHEAGLLNGLNILTTKKNRPVYLQPLRGQEINLEKHASQEQNMRNKPEKPRRLEKIARSPHMQN